MSTETTALLATALRLPDEERAALLEGLYHSFDDRIAPESEARRIAEAESRVDAFQAGLLASVSEDEAYARLEL